MPFTILFILTVFSQNLFAGNEYLKPSHTTEPIKADDAKDAEEKQKTKTQKEPPPSSYKESGTSGTKEKKEGHYGPKSPSPQRPEGHVPPAPGSMGVGGGQ